MKKESIANPKITSENTLPEGLPINDAPLIYSDQMVGMAIGMGVSKIVLAIENSPSQPIPKLTLVMPTQALHQMAKQILEVLSSGETQEQLGDAFKSYQESVNN